jgi:tetratricopeptide (TPR) repeat protein
LQFNLNFDQVKLYIRNLNKRIDITILCVAAFVGVFFQGCSTEKNTGISRAYHNVTTRYNVLFNARESYRRGVKKAEESKQDDYTHILPLFLYGDEAVAQAVAGDMEMAAKKASKAINLHSIKAKPKVGRSGMSPSEKKFYDRKEFNRFLDDCYLLIGKSYLYTGQYFQALQTFNFIQAEFPEEESSYEARVWKSKTLIQEKDYREAERMITELREDGNFPGNKALKAEMAATTADLYIRQQRYDEAIGYLEQALALAGQKSARIRYRYVLAQLYLEQKDYANASENFKKVVKMNPPYEMSFNATISLATASQNSGADIRDVRKQLNKMLRDSKNTEYRDQIYYVLAEIELYEDNTDRAIEYLQMSARTSTVNIPQKTKSYLALGNLFYDRHSYIPAQAYYDSAMVNMQPDYPNYTQIAAKAENLNALAVNLNMVHFQDSVQRIARLPEGERNSFIDNIINELRRKEQLQKEAEEIRLQQYYNNLGRQSSLNDPTAQTQWYFYNPATVSQGIGEFQIKWGRRGLEDNWRRKNKSSMGDLGAAGEYLNDEDVQAAGAQKATDVYTREYYLQNVPLTDSMMMASSLMILEGLYAAGYIYNNDFGEYALSALQYEELIRRYPNSEYVISSYYYLYRLYTNLNDGANAAKYKDLLLAKAPESTFARIILDPSYLDRMAQQQGEAEQLYEQAYNHYNGGRYDRVIAIAGDAAARYSKDVLAPKFAYLKALSEGKSGTRETMRDEMKKIVAAYPGDEVAVAAQGLIDYIDGKDPAMKQADQVERAKSIYTHDTSGTFYFGWAVQAKEDINQLSFDLLNFNLDNYPNTKLEFVRNNINDGYVILVIKSFPDLANVQKYYRSFLMDANTMKNAKQENTPFIISESNYAILDADKKVEDYIEFFKTAYLEQ